MGNECDGPPRNSLDTQAAHEVRSGDTPTQAEIDLLCSQARVEAEVELRKRKDADSDLAGHLIVPNALIEDLKHQAYLLGSASDAIIELRELDDTVQYWNQGAEKLYGWAPADAMGKNIHSLLKTVFPAPLNEIKATVEKRGDWLGEVIHTKRDGTQVFVASHWTLERERETGRATTWLEINRDISDRKKSELELINARHALEESNTSLRELSASLLRAQDGERRRIARELHDDVGQYLIAIIMALDGARKNPASAARKIDEADEAARSCMTDIRTISHLLHPPLLDELGLSSAVKQYVEAFALRSGIDVRVEIPNDLRRLDNNIEIALFRVLQESLTNIHRHSGSKSATVHMSADAEKVWLEIQDQGKGNINANGDPSGHLRAGVGVTGMRERVRELGGVLEITADEKGTHVKAVVPLAAEPPKITVYERVSTSATLSEKFSRCAVVALSLKTAHDTPAEPALKYPWQQAVPDAFTETRSASLPGKVNAAQRAISARLCDNTPADSEEQIDTRGAAESACTAPRNKEGIPPRVRIGEKKATA